MKTYSKTTTSKLITRFDNDLRNLLMEDLKSFKGNIQSVAGNKQATMIQQLKAA